MAPVVASRIERPVRNDVTISRESGDHDEKFGCEGKPPMPPPPPPSEKMRVREATSKTWKVVVGMSVPTEMRVPSRESAWQPTHIAAPVRPWSMKRSARAPGTPNSKRSMEPPPAFQ